MQTTQRATVEAIPMLPLLDAVLFPHSKVQLDLFEPRYFQLAKDAVSSKTPVAIARLSGGSGSPALPPPVFPIAGYGRVDWFEQHNSGAAAIGITGLGRLHLHTELRPSRPYRQVSGRVLPDEPGQLDDAFFEEFRSMLLSANPAIVHRPEELLALLDVPPPLGVFSDLACHFLCTRIDERQVLLEERNPERRLRLLHDILARQVAATGQDLSA